MENEQHFIPSSDMKYGMIALFILLFICILIAVVIAISVVPKSNRFIFLFPSLIPLLLAVYTVYLTFPFNKILILEGKIVSKKYFSSITIEWDEVIKIYEQITMPPYSMVSGSVILVIVPRKGIKKITISNTIKGYEKLRELVLEESKVNTFDYKAGKMRIHEWTRKSDWPL